MNWCASLGEKRSCGYSSGRCRCQKCKRSLSNFRKIQCQRGGFQKVWKTVLRSFLNKHARATTSHHHGAVADIRANPAPNEPFLRFEAPVSIPEKKTTTSTQPMND